MLRDRFPPASQQPAPGAPVEGGARDLLIRALRDHRLLDGAWYLRTYPDVAAAGIDPLEHFLSSGMAEGRDPSPLFSSAHYLSAHPDVAQSGIQPLWHFLTSGGAENRASHPLVAPRWLRHRLPPGLPFDNPLLGLLATREAIPPRPLFDLAHVAAALGLPVDSRPAEVAAAWLALPPAGRPDPHPLVSLAHLRGQPGAPPHGCALEAYLRDRGATLAPHPLYDRDFLRRAHPGLAEADPELTPLEVLLTGAGGADLTLSPLFDPQHYRRQAALAGLPADLGGQSALVHYLQTGAAQGIEPHPLFDEAAYRARHLRAGEREPGLLHYLRLGREPWISLAPRFPDAFYLTRHPEVRDDFPGPALLHYLAYGRAELRKLPEPAWRDDFASWDQVRAEVRAGAAALRSEDPEVSVIIPAYDQFLFTLRCLWSILKAGDRTRLQVILADDGSTDETQAFCEGLEGITYHRNPGNMGFLRSCNHAAGLARAPFLFFLNNDTAVLPGWIDRLVELARATPEAGILGSKLVYPDGTLQEAGGYVWAGGGGANLGRGADPAEPGFNLRRDADYISGAAILVPAAAWQAAGGFDTRYVPAYCEDTDLAMRLRQLGFRVIYQPASTVVHFEGVSSGTSTDSGVKAYQVTNFEKLRARWAFALERHLPAQPVHPRAIPRPRRPRILMIDHEVPRPDRDAGSLIAWWHIRLYLEMGYEVTFVPSNLLPDGDYGAALQALGVEVIHAPYVKDLARYLDRHAEGFDLFYLTRVGHGGQWIERLRTLCPRTPIIFNTADLHFLRKEREARLRGDPPEEVAEAQITRDRELAVISAASDTILVSQHEHALLRSMGVRDGLSVIPLVLPLAEAVPPREGRRGIGFVGGYRHTPNVDAVMHFLTHIWPLVHEAAPELEFHIIGSSPPPAFDALDLPGVRVVGFVPDLDACLGGLIATVAPLTYGAGIKGKIGSSLAAGVPCVATPVGAEGMGLEDGAEILIAEAPADFAAAVLRLVDDPALWERLSRGGRAFVRREYSPEATRQRLLRQLAKVGAPPFAGTCPLTGAEEQRRFLRDGDPAALAAGPEAPDGCERVAAAALARLAGAPDRPLARLAPRALGPVAVGPGLERLATLLAARGDLADGPAPTGVARLALDGGMAGAVEALLSGPLAGAGRLVLACAPPGGQPGEVRADPWPIAATVKALEAAGWEVRTDRLPLPECALTGVALVEARRPAA